MTMAFMPGAALPIRRPPAHRHQPVRCIAAGSGRRAHSSEGRMTRRAVLRAFGAFAGLSVAAHVGAAVLGEEDVVSILQDARARLERCDALIAEARWDAVRTVLGRHPLVSLKEASRSLALGAPSDVKQAVLGVREDALSTMRLLDTAVYSNVFIGEDREILGTKVDYDTPRTYLRDLKESLDTLIDLAAGLRT